MHGGGKIDRRNMDKLYYFIDVDVSSLRIIGWGTEKFGEVEVELSDGYHRVFLSKGQFNKLERHLKQR